MKDKFSFTCNPNFKPDADFYITYDRDNWNWNDFGYHVRYLIYATPKITPNKKEVLIGEIGILGSDQKIAEHGLLENTLRESGNYSLFHELPEFFSSRIYDRTATMLWMLLNPEQRKEFIGAMHLILEADGPYWETICSKASGLFREGHSHVINQLLDTTKNIMLSPTDFKMTKECYQQLFE